MAAFWIRTPMALTAVPRQSDDATGADHGQLQFGLHAIAHNDGFPLRALEDRVGSGEPRNFACRDFRRAGCTVDRSAKGRPGSG